MKKTYAFGDIHGCLRQLKQLVELCEQDAGEHEARFIFLGDYIDRGPDSKGVIEYLMMLQSIDPVQFTCLLGNHEHMLLAAIEDQRNEGVWLKNGGEATLWSYEVHSPIDIPRAHIDWQRSLPLSHDDGQRFFVHAGVHPGRPINEQDEHDLIWIRSPFLECTKDFGRFVVHGHTPLTDGLPDVRSNRVNLDTGACYGRPLTAAVFTDRSPFPERFLHSL